MYKIIYGLIFLNLLYACHSTKETTIILDKHADELFSLAKEKNQLLCLFLGGGEQCNNCTYKMKELQQKGILTDFDKDYIFAGCNAGETMDAYLHHCLIMIGLPTIYIFSPEGKLLSFMFNLTEPELVRVLLESTLGGDPSPLVKHPQFQSGFQDLLNMQNLVLDAYRELKEAANDTL